MKPSRGSHVIVVGCGAIGSFLVTLLWRIVGVTCVTLIDPDTYRKSNLATQNIFRSDVGEPKVAVQARRLRAANTQIDVAAIPAALEDVPLGMLRGDLIVGCVNSNLARQSINEIAWRWQIPWVDSGILESQRLARVSVFVPGAQAPCLECGWGANDYATLEAEYPCGADRDEQHSDSSPALASLAASLQVIECQKLLDGVAEHRSTSRQLTVNVRTHRLLSTVFRRNLDCRFDHAAWNPVPLRCSLEKTTVAEALASLGRIRVAGHRFATRLICPHCGFWLDGLRLDRPKARCPKCGMRMTAREYGSLLACLDASFPREHMGRSLAEIGLLHGDIVCGADKQVELLPEVL